MAPSKREPNKIAIPSVSARTPDSKTDRFYREFDGQTVLSPGDCLFGRREQARSHTGFIYDSWSMTVQINGQPTPIAEGSTLASILEERKLSPDKVAVEVNRRLVRAEKYDTPLKEGDEIEIVTFVGGG